MENNKKEKLINKLLVFMNNELEKSGDRIKNVTFSFSEEDEDFIMFSKKHDICFDEFSLILNVCLTRKFIKRASLGGSEYASLQLTEGGQDRAISSLNRNKPLYENSGNIHIENLHSSGVTQIGDNNILNIEQVFLSILEKIEESDATKEEKREAKGKLKAFIEHPVTNSILGAFTATLLSKMGG